MVIKNCGLRDSSISKGKGKARGTYREKYEPLKKLKPKVKR